MPRELDFDTKKELPSMPRELVGVVQPMQVYNMPVVCMQLQNESRARYYHALCPTAIKHMNVTMGMENATVNFMTAFSPYVDAIRAHAQNKLVDMPLISVPITNAVVEVKVQDGVIDYHKRDSYPSI